LASGGSQACLDDVGRRKQPVDPVGQQLHSMLCRPPPWDAGAKRRNPVRKRDRAVGFAQDLIF
jgi:hypothetical protein